MVKIFGLRCCQPKLQLVYIDDHSKTVKSLSIEIVFQMKNVWRRIVALRKNQFKLEQKYIHALDSNDNWNAMKKVTYTKNQTYLFLHLKVNENRKKKFQTHARTAFDVRLLIESLVVFIGDDYLFSTGFSLWLFISVWTKFTRLRCR